MNLLITSAIKLEEYQVNELKREHQLFYLGDETIPLSEEQKDFDLMEIEGIVCNSFFQSNSFDVFPNLKFVQLTSAGLDRVPLKQLESRGVIIYSADSTYAIPMAEWAIGKLLEIYKHSYFFNDNKRKLRWEKRRDLGEIYGTRATIIGFGNVGRNIAVRLKAFGVLVRAVDIVKDESKISDEWYSIEDLKSAIKAVDIVFITLPLTDATKHIIDDNILSEIDKDAVLINLGRGALIDESSLIKHLGEGRFRGVALDVFEEEPLPKSNPLWIIERVIITPHISFVGNGNQKRLYELLSRNLTMHI